MVDIITKKSYQNLQTSLKTIIELFKKIPYGWSDTDISGIILVLFKKQDIRLELAGENLLVNNPSIIDYITKRDYLDRVLVKIRVKVTQVLLNNAKNLAKELFTISDMPLDEDGVMARLKELSRLELNENNNCIKDLLAYYQAGKYPGKAVLESGKKLFEEVLKIKEVTSFFNFLNTEKESFLDYEEDISDVRKFFKNQKDIFDNAVKMLNIYESNRSYILDADTICVVDNIEKITKLPSPYGEIHKLPDLINDFRIRFGNILIAECEPIQKDIETDFAIVRTEMTKHNLNDVFGGRAELSFNGLLQRLEKVNDIYEAIAMRTVSDRLKLRFFDEFIAEVNRRVVSDTKIDNKKPVTPAIKVKTVSVNSLFSGTNQVSNTEEIDKLLAELRVKLVSQLDVNTIIKIV